MTFLMNYLLRIVWVCLCMGVLHVCPRNCLCYNSWLFKMCKFGFIPPEFIMNLYFACLHYLHISNVYLGTLTVLSFGILPYFHYIFEVNLEVWKHDQLPLKCLVVKNQIYEFRGFLLVVSLDNWHLGGCL